MLENPNSNKFLLTCDDYC